MWAVVAWARPEEVATVRRSLQPKTPVIGWIDESSKAVN
jgi:hypothetical protein